MGYGWVERGEGWRGVEKRSREGIRIISDYNLLYGDHQRYRTRSRVEEGCVGKRCVGSRFLFKPFQTAMLSSRFSFFFFFLSPLISAEPSLSLDECTAFNVNQRPVTIASTLLEPRVYFSRVYMCIHIYVYIYIHVRPAFRVYLSPSLAFSRSPGLRSRIN